MKRSHFDQDGAVSSAPVKRSAKDRKHHKRERRRRHVDLARELLVMDTVGFWPYE